MDVFQPSSVRWARTIELLNLRRRNTMQNPDDEFGVSWDMIQRDRTIREQESPVGMAAGRPGPKPAVGYPCPNICCSCSRNVSVALENT